MDRNGFDSPLRAPWTRGRLDWLVTVQVLDQTMDLRNDLMKVVYPFGAVKTPDAFPDAFKQHFTKSASSTFKKLEGFVKTGPFVLGADPHSGDFMLFEMRAAARQAL